MLVACCRRLSLSDMCKVSWWWSTEFDCEACLAQMWLCNSLAVWIAGGRHHLYENEKNLQALKPPSPPLCMKQNLSPAGLELGTLTNTKMKLLQWAYCFNIKRSHSKYEMHSTNRKWHSHYDRENGIER